MEESEGTATDVDLDSVLSWDSEISERSNDADLQAAIEPNKSWVTVEDRAIDSAKHLATHFRTHPLLPCALSDRDLQALGSNSGLVYPAVHCAFDGCWWASDAVTVSSPLVKRKSVAHGGHYLVTLSQNLLRRCYHVLVGTPERKP